MVQVIRFSLAFSLVAMLGAGVSAETIKGDYIEARTCEVYTGSCVANSEFGLTGDQAIMAWKVESGRWNGIDLAGLSVVAAVKAASTLGDEFSNPYPAKGVLIVDEKATSEQKTALVSFAKANAGRLLDDIVRIETAPIEMVVGCCEKKACARLIAGKLAAIETRCATENDHLCGNEWVYYQPLTKVHKDFVPAVTVSHEFRGRGLKGTWSSPNKRSAFIGSFSR